MQHYSVLASTIYTFSATDFELEGTYFYLEI